jgi:hypothetical protein
VSRSLAKVVGAALASVLMLAGCAAGTHPGAAAVVGGTEISVKQVDEVSRSLSTALGQPITASVALNDMVRTVLVGTVVAQRSVTISDAEIAAAKSYVIGDPAVLAKVDQDPVGHKFLEDVARTVVGTVKLGGGTGRNLTSKADAAANQAAGQAGGKIILDAANNIKIDVAPRFGKWTNGAIDGKVSGSLSDLSPQTKASQDAASQQQQQQQQQQQPQPQG